MNSGYKRGKGAAALDCENVKIKVEGLTKDFGDLRVLNNISFDVKKGEFVCIVGPTGCGKTTFLNILSKIWDATSGRLLIDGEEADPKKHNIAFAFQESSAFPWLTVEQNIRFGMEHKHLPKNVIDERTEQMLELLGLAGVRNYLPKQISASMESRVVIGRSFAIHPDLLIMDEPYAQLDIQLRYHLEDAVLKLSKATESTVIFVTHNIEEAVYLAERCVVLTNKPTKVKTIENIGLPYPRDICSREFIDIQNRITNYIKWW